MGLGWGLQGKDVVCLGRGEVEGRRWVGNSLSGERGKRGGLASPKQLSSAVSGRSVGGEKLVKGREVYCTNRDGADQLGPAKIGGPYVFVKLGLLSPRGEESSSHSGHRLR